MQKGTGVFYWGVQKGTREPCLKKTPVPFFRPTTTWSGLGSTVQAWLDGTVTNHGLFFPDLGNAVAGTEEASGDYVKWTLDAQIVGVPEPSTLALAALTPRNRAFVLKG